MKGQVAAVVVAIACGAAGGEAAAQGETLAVDSSATNAPAEAFGPLFGGNLYAGLLVGGDTEDWLTYWLNPAWGGPLTFQASCPVRVEVYTTDADALVPAQLVNQLDVAAAPVQHTYSPPDGLVHRMLVRVARTDGPGIACGWQVEPLRNGAAFLRDPIAPRLTVTVHKVAGRATAVSFKSQVQPKYSPPRDAKFDVSGALNRTIQTTVRQSGIASGRVALPAGLRGKITVTLTVGASAKRPASPAVSTTVSVVTTRAPAATKPVKPKSTPRPKPPRRVTPKPVTPAVAIHRFFRNPPGMMKPLLRQGKFSQGYDLGPTRRLPNGWTTTCVIARVKADPIGEFTRGYYLGFSVYTQGAKNHRVRYAESANFSWPPRGKLPPVMKFARCPRR